MNEYTGLRGLTPMTRLIEADPDEGISEQWQGIIYDPITSVHEVVWVGARTPKEAGDMAAQAIKDRQIQQIWSRKDRSFDKACWDYE